MPRYIKIPEPQPIGDITVVEKKDGDEVAHPLTLSFSQLHNLGIWSSSKWLASTDNAAVQAELRPKLDAAKPGELVKVSDDHFGIYQPIALQTQPDLNGTKLAPLSQFVGAARIQLLAPVISPSTKPPEHAEPETKDDSTAAKPASKDE